MSDDEDEEDNEKILDDEVRIAPWTLTRTFFNALHGGFKTARYVEWFSPQMQVKYIPTDR